MRRAIAIVIAAGAWLAGIAPASAWELSSRPEESWTFMTFRASYGYTMGTREGVRTLDMQPVSLDYVDHTGAFEFELEDYDGRSPGQQRYPAFLGVAFGLRMVARIGAVASYEWEQQTGVDAATGPIGWAAPVRFSFGAGTMAQIVRTEEFVLAAHFSLELHGARSTWTQDVSFSLFPGLRMVWQPSPLRLQLGYDFLPLFVGQSRMEHRPSAAAAIQLGPIGLGVRFTATIGQEQRGQRTYDDLTLGGALELVL